MDGLELSFYLSRLIQNLEIRPADYKFIDLLYLNSDIKHFCYLMFNCAPKCSYNQENSVNIKQSLNFFNK